MQEDRSLQEEHNEKALLLMQTLGISMDEALNLLKRTGFDLDAAANIQLMQKKRYRGSIIEPHDNYLNVIDLDDQEYEEFKKPNRRGQYHRLANRTLKKQFTKTYLIKKKEKLKPKKNRIRTSSKNSKDNSNSKEQKMEEEEEKQFLPALKTSIESQIHISFYDDLADALREMFQQKKVVALHCLELSNKDLLTREKEIQSPLEHVKMLYTTKEFVQNCNKLFINYGLDFSTFDFDHYPFMKEFISIGDEFSIIFLRLNEYSNKIEVLKKCKLTQTFKLTETQKFGSMMTSFNRQHNKMAYNSFLMKKPISKQQKEKIELDRLIRQQQQQLYFQHMNVIEQIKAQQLLEKKEEQKFEETLQSNKEKRQKKRLELLQYDSDKIQNPIEFKIRMPNSSIIKLKIPKEQKIQYLFDYIQTISDEDIGFDNQHERKFDLIQPLQRVSLLEKKQQTIGEVFEGTNMETLAVKEI